MKIELSEEVTQEMYLLNLKRNSILAINVERQSKSGDTIETVSGARFRTDTKTHKIFNSYTFAQLARKQNLKQFDAEYDDLCQCLKLRKSKQFQAFDNR